MSVEVWAGRGLGRWRSGPVGEDRCFARVVEVPIELENNQLACKEMPDSIHCAVSSDSASFPM